MTKLTQLGLRVPDDLLAKLQDVCDRRGSTMNAVLNERLRESFSHESSELFDNKELFGILQVVAAAMSTAGQLTAVNDTLQPSEAGRWPQNAVAYDQAVQAAIRVLETFRPDGNVKPRSTPGFFDLSTAIENLGFSSADIVIAESATGIPQNAATADRARRLHEALSEAMIQRNRVAKARSDQIARELSDRTSKGGISRPGLKPGSKEITINIEGGYTAVAGNLQDEIRRSRRKRLKHPSQSKSDKKP
jgi:hypothetical protein